MKLRKLQLLALLVFLLAGVSWRFKDPRHFFEWQQDSNVYRTVVNPQDAVPEKMAWPMIDQIAREHRQLMQSNISIDQYSDKLDELMVRLTYLNHNTVLTEELNRSQEYDYSEAPARVFAHIMNVEVALYEDHQRCCGENYLWYDQLKAKYPRLMELNLRPGISVETTAINRYKFGRLLIIAMFGLGLLLFDRGRQTGWSFERMIGYRLLRVAAYSAALAFSLFGGCAVAQQLIIKKDKNEQYREKVLGHENRSEDTGSGEGDSKKTILSIVPNKGATLSMLLFGDVTGKQGHDRQLIWQYTAKNGFTVLQQSRQTAESAGANGNITLGWKFKLSKQFDLTATAGPAFNYENAVKLGGFNHQTIVFLIANWSTRFFRFTSLNKLIVPTSEKAAFADRHVQTIRGPTEKGPKWLQGLALQMEDWHTNGPKDGHWAEFLVGPAINIGETIGKPKGFLARWTIFPYYDFCRPQSGHNRMWDLRIQYKQTFSFAR